MFQARVLTVFLLFLSFTSLSHGNVIIDFESLSHSGTAGFSTSPYHEDGFSIASNVGGVTAFGVWGTSSPHFAGSTALYNNIGLITTLTKGDAGPFDATSIELSHLFDTTMGNDRLIVTFEGTKSDTSTVTHSVDVPKHFGFVTYPLPGFTDLVSMTWDQSAFGSVPHQFDNISVVPERPQIPPLVGDTDGDGDVDIVDLNNVRNHFGDGEILGPPVFGEAYPFNGVVDLGDLNLVRNHFGTSAETASIPEPTALLSMLLGAFALLFGSRCHPS